VIVAVTGGKGGPGATVLAVRLALSLAESGRDCLLLDLDPWGGDVGTYVDSEGLDPRRGLLPLLKLGPVEGQESIERECQSISKHLSLVLGFMRPEPDLLHGRIEGLLRSALRVAEIVVVDLGRIAARSPSLESLSLSDHLLLAVRPDLQGALAAERALALTDGRPTLVATQVRRRGGADVVELSQALGRPVAASVPYLRDAASPRSPRRLQHELSKVHDALSAPAQPIDLPKIPHEVAVS
jgi:Mrp family chromosome partitioning ATPase